MNREDNLGGLDVLVNQSLRQPLSIIETALKEANVSGDVASYSDLISGLINRTRLQSVVGQITAVIPSTTPTARIPIFSAKMVGKTGTAADTIIVLKVDDVNSFAVDGTVASNGGATGTVLYIEAPYLLVKVDTGTFAESALLDNVAPYAVTKATVAKIYSNSYGVGHILPGYVGPYSTSTGEGDVANSFEWVVSHLETEAETRTLKTRATEEVIFDMAKMYKENFPERMEQSLANIIVTAEESECFNYMSSIATKHAPLVLTNSYGVNTSIKSVYEDIVARINKLKAQIGTDTNLAGRFFVIASSNVVAAIETVHNLTSFKQDLDYEKMNTRIAGRMPNGILVVEDPYALEDYFTVGSAGIVGMDNPGVYYVPYAYDLVMTTDSETFEQVLGVKERCSFERNPMDTKIGTAGSDFFHYVPVDFSNLTNH